MDADPLVTLILAQPGMAERLLDMHVADLRGHCLGCALPQSGFPAWPCTTHAAAHRAIDIQRRRRAAGFHT